MTTARITNREATSSRQQGPKGLSEDEAAARLIRFGPNVLPEPHRESWVNLAVRQLREPMALLLIGASLVSWLWLSERLDAGVIVAIVLLNAAIGMAEEGKAARALEALRSMATPRAVVRRGGLTREVPASNLVPGDAVVLAAGDQVPADLRILEASAFEVDESMLTGESLPVAKRPARNRTASEAADDEASFAFSGTLATRGSAEGLVVATGSGSRLGEIAATLDQPARRPTPLQAELGRLTARVGTIAVLIAGAVFGLTVLRMGLDPGRLREAFLTAVALAVAAVPEGLATVVAVALALGVRRMAARGAIVRRLPAVETLGATTVIATDKTGTLTRNRMSLDSVTFPGTAGPALNEAGGRLDAVLEAAILCNDSQLEPPLGDPMELALLEGAGRGRVTEVRASNPRLASVPFDSARRLMTTLHVRPDGRLVLMLKGAPEAVVERCSFRVDQAGPIVPLEVLDALEVLKTAARMATEGTRVLALASRDLQTEPDDLEEAQQGMTLLGLAGLRDPIREESRQAVAECRSAGIRVVMVTGDHPGTAAAIGEQAGIVGPGGQVVLGSDLPAATWSDEIVSASVFARVEPQHKLALVRELQSRGHVVAVTGDGVNDAPALRRADIGVAMGRSGSDVAREAADMVITDDNLATIVTAVREGRAIYDNVRKVVDYLVAGNLSEITVVIATLLLFPSVGVPLLPIQLLWINLVTDGMPAIALGLDPPDPGLMSRPPRSRSQPLLDVRRAVMLGGRAALIAGASVGSLVISRFGWGEPWSHARALMFTVLVVAHLLYAFVARHPTRGLASNRWLVIAVGGGIALQFLLSGWSAAHGVFGTASLSLREWLLAAGAGGLPVAVMEAAARLRGSERRPRTSN